MISKATTDAIREQIADHLRSRTDWDEVPAVFTFHQGPDGTVRMWQLPVPEVIWHSAGHPPTALAGLAATASMLPRLPGGAHVLVRPGVGNLIGAALRYEAYALVGDSPHPAVNEAVRRRESGGSVPKFKDIPGRIEQRCITAVDLDGGRYMASSSRIDESKPEAAEPVAQYLAFGDPRRDRLTGNVVDAVTRFLNAIKPAPVRGAAR
ncbi:hypothetical protein [Streptomyces sp. NPDC004528]|uniref:hypothetical protein n=1 Tax=Streptomyces sp. NPDC004528 TaxID=3154550 RepID=UPI0033B87220